MDWKYLTTRRGTGRNSSRKQRERDKAESAFMRKCEGMRGRRKILFCSRLKTSFVGRLSSFLILFLVCVSFVTFQPLALLCPSSWRDDEGLFGIKSKFFVSKRESTDILHRTKLSLPRSSCFLLVLSLLLLSQLCVFFTLLLLNQMYLRRDDEGLFGIKPKFFFCKSKILRSKRRTMNALSASFRGTETNGGSS